MAASMRSAGTSCRLGSVAAAFRTTCRGIAFIRGEPAHQSDHADGKSTATESSVRHEAGFRNPVLPCEYGRGFHAEGSKRLVFGA